MIINNSRTLISLRDSWVDYKFPQNNRLIKVRKLLILTGIACISIGLFRGVLYALLGRFDLVVMYGVLIIIGLVACVSVRSSSQLALCGIGHALLVFILSLAILDVPTAEIPRSAHLFLLPLAAACFYVFGTERRYMGVFFPMLSILGFILIGARIISLDIVSLTPPNCTRWATSIENHVLSALILIRIIVIYRVDMSSRIAQTQELARAIAQKQLVVLYQPQVNVNGKTIGAEALVRWQHPARGLLTPEAFIPLAEESLLIIDVGLEVLRQVCERLRQWNNVEGLKGMTLAVNVSPIQLRDPDFTVSVKKILQDTKANPARLELELTESALSSNTELVRAMMWELKNLGVRWALDDFGTGFSSLALLRTLPLQKIKIDRQFIMDAMDDPQGRILLEKIIEIPEALGMSCIAEGVEGITHFELLKEIGCRQFQGYLFGRPQTANSLMQSFE